jgi:hypothetical protein
MMVLNTSSLAVLEFLNNVFPEKRIGRGGATPWPVRFSNHVVSDVQDLQIRIQNGSEMIRTTPGIFQGVSQSLFKRAKSCVEAQDGRTEHFL